MTPEEEISRAGEAARLLQSPIFLEASEHIHAQLKQLRERAPISDNDMMVRIVLMEQLWARLLDYLQNAMTSGDFARNTLRARETAVERVKQSLKYGLRNAF